MTGIERLRELVDGISPIIALCGVTKSSYDREHMELAGKLLRDFLDDIADQIAREYADDCQRMGLYYGAVSRVVIDMEHHVLGVEGMEDSPVARWARELREALGCRDEEVTDVATVRKDAYDAYEWVEAHGGLDYVMHEWQSRVPRDRYERRSQRLLDHIAECETALGRRRRRIEELGRRVNDLTTENAELRRRAMPEGCEWPRYESGEMVRIGDAIVDEMGHAHEVSSVEVFDDAEALHWIPSEPEDFVWLVHGERVKRPAPKVLDADGAEIRVGDTVWGTNGHGPFEVTRTVYADRLRVICDDEKNGHLNAYPEMLTHRAPVLAADGKPLREGETVWVTRDSPCDAPLDKGDKVTVRHAYPSNVLVEDEAGESWIVLADHLTHERPESKCRDCAHWQKDPTADNMGVCWFFYHEHEGQDCYAARRADIGACEEFMPRARELAERERSE